MVAVIRFVTVTCTEVEQLSEVFFSFWMSVVRLMVDGCGNNTVEEQAGVACDMCC